MSYSLFLDDERYPHKVDWVALPLCEWTIARSVKEFQEIIKARGLPKRVSFDHDLADEHYVEGAKTNFKQFNYSNVLEKTGLDAARWLAEYCLERNLDLPEYFIHTKNPCGALNIKSILESYASSRTRP